MVRIFNDLN